MSDAATYDRLNEVFHNVFFDDEIKMGPTTQRQISRAGLGRPRQPDDRGGNRIRHPVHDAGTGSMQTVGDMAAIIAKKMG